MDVIHEEVEVKQFISNVLEIQLPNQSLQDILKDGVLLCNLIQRFLPNCHILKNDGKTKFAYQDNIGQFLREAERVISCLLAIQRIMRDRKLIPDSMKTKKKSNQMLFLTTDRSDNSWVQRKEDLLQTYRKRTDCVQPKTVSSHFSRPLPSPPATRRYSEASQLSVQLSNDQPTPSKSTPTVEQVIGNNRKASLKKMGSCAITVYNEEGEESVYALGKSIGKGQFGEVFGGLNMDTGEYVAIKRIKRNEMNCDDMNEVGVLKHLNHEYIVRYKGFSKDKIYINIILEYVEMGSLLNNIRAFGKFPEKLAASYTYKILSGLNYLHSQQVIHCDLKAANILTTKTGSLKLTDFGVSLSTKMKDDETTGEPAGTPNWMAPEIIKLAGASTKSDIWSLGCTIIEMLTGKPPYSGMHSFAALYKIVEDDEPPIPKNLVLSKDVREFLLSCFKKTPEDRPSAYELMKYKWMEPFFQKDEPPLLRKSKSANYLPCTHDRTSSRDDLQGTCTICLTAIDENTRAKQCKDCEQIFHAKCISSPRKNSTEKSYTPLPPLPVHDEKTYYLSKQYTPGKVSNTGKGFNIPSSIMT
ncbi:hypothetical protein G6F56_006494 [Rhizopus delemar]|nr:hypothetical protein G6F56_006494 [Rhizopus delemar]